MKKDEEQEDEEQEEEEEEKVSIPWSKVPHAFSLFCIKSLTISITMFKKKVTKFMHVKLLNELS